jgi:hypothetical protein
MLTLKEFLNLNKGNAVDVTVKEPGKCFTFSTVLKEGKPNIHIDDFDLRREVYSIGVVYNKDFNGNILHVYAW